MNVARLAKAGIKVPRRIERGPTDILKALASTVKFLPTEPDTILHDDPFLLPIRPNDRVNYSLAKISGVNTAKFLLNKHPELFLRDDAEPKIRAFNPPEEYREDMQFTIEDLRWCIDHKDPVNGVIAYKALKDKDETQLEDELKLQFFEMICYTNEDALLDSNEHQKAFYSREQERFVKTNWKNDCVASKIFNELKQDTDPSRVYSAMICGMIKHGEHQTAKDLFDEFKESHADKGLFTTAYDYMIKSVLVLHSSVATAHGAISEIVRDMERHLVVPDLHLFNSIFNVYRKFDCDTDTCHEAFRLITDMRMLKIEPSLFTYACLFNIINRSRENRNQTRLVEEILSYMVSRDDLVEIRDERDQQALLVLMQTFANRMNNLRLSSQVFKIYLKQPNLFVSAHLRMAFFENYFRLLITTEKLESILDFYNTYVPMQMRPSAEVYDALVETLDLYQADEETVKKIGMDVVRFGLADRLKSDQIFRKDPAYIDELERRIEAKTKYDRIRET